MSNFQSLCQNLVKDEALLNQFINQQFNTFFSQFNAFLIQYQLQNTSKHPLQGTFKKKKVLNIFDDVLNNVKYIISKTKKNNYSPQLKVDIKDAFTCLLHPYTSDRIRQNSIPIFYLLIERLGDHAYEMLQDVARFVFDFQILREECSRESNFDLIVDQNKCINIPDIERTNKEHLIKNIEEFEKKIIKSLESDNCHLFPFFRKMMLIPAYDRAINKNATFGISGVAPQVLHKAIVTVLNAATKSTTFKTVVNDSMGYFMEAAIQASNNYSSLEESRTFVLQFFKKLCNDQNKDVLKVQPIGVICRGLEALLDLIQTSGPKADDIVTCYDKALKYFQLCLSIFEKERKSLAIQLVNWPHPESLPQILIILLTGFVNVGIEDPELWDLLKEPSKYPSIFLSTLSVFSSYFSFSISQTLLKYTNENLSTAMVFIESQNNWTGKDSNQLMKKLVSNKNPTFFFSNTNNLRKSFCLQDNIPYLYPIECNTWKPFVETIKNLNYESIQDSDLQFKTYLVGVSFVYPLITLITNFPPDLEYSVEFIIENYLDWLKECCSPSKTNPYIIHSSLTNLGDIFTNDLCVHSVSDECVLDWVLTLQHYIKSSNQKIKIKALILGCKAIYNGILGSSSILNDDIASNLLTTSKLGKIQLSAINSIELINNIESQYRASYLFRILIESVYNSKSENLEQIVAEIITLLTQNARVVDIYNLWPMILFIKEMKNLNEEIVDKLILELIASIEKVDPSYGDALLQFVCDLIVYSSSKKGIERFNELPEDYKQRHVLLFISRYFNNLTYPLYETNGFDKQFFTNGRHEILQFYDKNKISTNLAVGHFAFQFNQFSETEMDETTLPDPNNFNSTESLSIPDSTNYEFQEDLNNSATNFFKEGLFSPSDFNVQNDKQKDDESFPENYSQKLVEFPKTYGVQSAAFASSTGFTDPISSYRFVPCGFPTFTADMNIPYKKKIKVGIRFKSETPHLKSFQKGLGILNNSDGNTILYKDCRYEITFIINSTIKANKIEIFWNDKNPNSFIPENRARIQISEMDDGFLVETLFHKEIVRPNGLCDAVVSMKSLPAFAIAQVLAVHEIIKSKKLDDKHQLASNKLKTIEEENFPQRSSMFSNEKALLFV